VARKALRVNLSDLAAKGAQPAGFLLSLALPADVSEAWLVAFAAGLGADAEHYSCPLLGGDTDRTPGPITICIAAFGTLPQGSMVRRSGARVDDRILVTGSIGDAALGLQARRAPDAARRWKLTPAEAGHLAQRYLVPQPRNALAEAVRLHATAAMDVSDGLAGDLGKLCAASGISAEVEAMRVPLSEAARAACAAEPSVIETILTGGDDYEIVCTMPAAKLGSFRAAAAAAKVAVTEIGRVRAGAGAPRFLDGAGKTMVFKRASFSHF
jgi:thiamine-monophosphate kinase